jgi:hypothetical protein
MGCIHSSEMIETKVVPKILSNIGSNIGSPKSPISEDPRSPGYNTPDKSSKHTEETKPNLRIRIPSENKSKVMKYTRKKYIDEDDESYSLFCKF